MLKYQIKSALLGKIYSISWWLTGFSFFILLPPHTLSPSGLLHTHLWNNYKSNALNIVNSATYKYVVFIFLQYLVNIIFCSTTYW